MGVLEAGKIYVLIVEPPGKDPDGVTDIGTEGLHHVVMDIPMRIINALGTNKKVYNFPDLGNQIQALGYFLDGCSITGIIEDTTQANTLLRQGYWSQFICEEREDTSLYLAICFGSDVYWRFYNTSAGVLRQYSKGAFVDKDLQFTWINSRTFAIQVTFTWKSNW